jgi:hypothetical protein
MATHTACTQSRNPAVRGYSLKLALCKHLKELVRVRVTGYVWHELDTFMPTVICGPEERELSRYISDVIRPSEGALEDMLKTQLWEDLRATWPWTVKEYG